MGFGTTGDVRPAIVVPPVPARALAVPDADNPLVTSENTLVFANENGDGCRTTGSSVLDRRDSNCGFSALIGVAEYTAEVDGRVEDELASMIAEVDSASVVAAGRVEDPRYNAPGETMKDCEARAFGRERTGILIR